MLLALRTFTLWIGFFGLPLYAHQICVNVLPSLRGYSTQEAKAMTDLWVEVLKRSLDTEWNTLQHSLTIEQIRFLRALGFRWQHQTDDKIVIETPNISDLRRNFRSLHKRICEAFGLKPEDLPFPAQIIVDERFTDAARTKFVTPHLKAIPIDASVPKGYKIYTGLLPDNAFYTFLSEGVFVFSNVTRSSILPPMEAAKNRMLVATEHDLGHFSGLYSDPPYAASLVHAARLIVEVEKKLQALEALLSQHESRWALSVDRSELQSLTESGVVQKNSHLRRRLFVAIESMALISKDWDLSFIGLPPEMVVNPTAEKIEVWLKKRTSDERTRILNEILESLPAHTLHRGGASADLRHPTLPPPPMMKTKPVDLGLMSLVWNAERYQDPTHLARLIAGLYGWQKISAPHWVTDTLIVPLQLRLKTIDSEILRLRSLLSTPEDNLSSRLHPWVLEMPPVSRSSPSAWLIYASGAWSDGLIPKEYDP